MDPKIPVTVQQTLEVGHEAPLQVPSVFGVRRTVTLSIVDPPQFQPPEGSEPQLSFPLRVKPSQRLLWPEFRRRPAVPQPKMSLSSVGSDWQFAEHDSGVQPLTKAFVSSAHS